MDGIEAGLLPVTGVLRAGGLARAVRGVKVYSRQSLGSCAPTYGRAELDFEPVPAGTASSCVFACTVRPEPDVELEEALVQGVLGVLREPAREDTGGPEADRGGTVADRGGTVGVQAIVRAMSWHPVDSCEVVFLRLGALAVREAFRCVAEDREPQEVVTRVSLL